MGKRSLARIGNTLQTSLSFLYGSAVLLVAMVIMDRPVLAGLAENWMVVAYVSVFVTGIGYLELTDPFEAERKEAEQQGRPLPSPEPKR
jgi:drug/metabolite transporter (DMT)-like permease